MDLKLLIPRNALFGECPKCNEDLALERVKSSGKFEKFYLSVFKLKKYHCKSCKWYGKLSVYAFPKNIKRVLLNYLFLLALIAISSLTISFILRKLFIP